jgi:DNA-directed RNA polymerase specialized sigma24 family protein
MADMAHLIEPVIPALRRYARTFVRDAADAEDLVQDTLERAISRWHQRRSDGDTRTWLFTILHNLALNHLRRGRRRPAILMMHGASLWVGCSLKDQSARCRAWSRKILGLSPDYLRPF